MSCGHINLLESSLSPFPRSPRLSCDTPSVSYHHPLSCPSQKPKTIHDFFLAFYPTCKCQVLSTPKYSIPSTLPLSRVDSSFIAIALYLVSRSLRFPISNSVFKLAQRDLSKAGSDHRDFWLDGSHHSTGPCVLTLPYNLNSGDHYGRRKRGTKQSKSVRRSGRYPDLACGGTMSQRQTGMQSLTTQMWLLLFPLSLPLIASQGCSACLGTTRLWCRELWRHLGFPCSWYQE